MQIVTSRAGCIDAILLQPVACLSRHFPTPVAYPFVFLWATEICTHPTLRLHTPGCPAQPSHVKDAMTTETSSSVRGFIASIHRFICLLLLVAGIGLIAPAPLYAQEPASSDLFDATSVMPRVMFNELLTNPETNTEWIEFIELYNAEYLPVNLEDWRISGGVDYLFPAGTVIPARGYLVIGEAPSHLQDKYGITALGPYDGGLSSSGEELVLTDNRAQTVDEIEYAYGFPWPMPDGEPDRTYQLIDPGQDNALGGNWRSNEATPGADNNTLVVNAPPTFLSVSHAPQQPKSNEVVTVEARVTDVDGIGAVRLLYQVVPPGEYYGVNDGYYHSNWTPITMTDKGSGRYSATIPGGLNQHRSLVRYRIEATDKGGRKQLVPFADDPQPNFAYFVYDGIPTWSGSFNGSSEGVTTFDFNAMRPLPSFIFISKEEDIANALFLPPSEYPSGYMGSDELWRGTLVYEGVVYDHVQYRARGGDFRYATGKSNWRINLHKGHRIQMYDNWGNPYPELADKINLYGISQHTHRGRRGEQGMFDSMTYRLYNEVGVAGPNTNWVQLRVIDSANETGATQYDSDFWGMYLSVEHPDGRFLDNHDLPDGNLYKVENYEGDLDNLSKYGPDDGSDYAAFQYAISYTLPSASWWTQNFDLDNYYSFRTILEFTHDYDVNQGKNFYYFHNSETNKWMILPWDKDLTWHVAMPGTGVEQIVDHVLTKPQFNLQYQNRMRELRDLLLNEEQIYMMLDEHANVIDSPQGGNTMASADRFMWDFNPIYETRYVDPARTAAGFYYTSTAERTFRAMVEQMKQYASQRFAWMDANFLTDRDYPDTPVLSYAGVSGYAVDGIRFTASTFSDPQGANTFAAMEWRLAETSLPWSPAPAEWTTQRKYEINAVWESGPITQNGGTLVPPAGVLEPGHFYRARVRYQDTSGRWSHWSDPVEFTAASATSSIAPVVISEVMYNPVPHNNWPGDELEFVEIHNTGNEPVDLSGWRIEDGIEYSFPAGTLLAADGYLVIAENESGYQTRYGLRALGEYDGKLSNGGERITLVDGWQRVVFSVEYGDDDPWPEQADGEGYSIVYILGSGDPDEPGSWRRSIGVNGSPGEAEPGAVVINEIRIAPANARAVELFNPGNKPADVSYWFLSDALGDPRKVHLPAGSVIPAGGYLVVDADTLVGSSYDGAIDWTPYPNMFLMLTSGRADGGVSGYQTWLYYGAPDAGQSVGTYVDSQGVTQFPLLSSPTFGNVNAAPLVGPLVISKILYNPTAGADQYVEITNISNTTVTLGGDDPTRTWQMQGGFYSFPGGFMLPAGGRVLVTSGSPHASCAAMDDRGYTRIFGPFAPSLAMDRQKIALTMPTALGTVVMADAVEYEATEAWPALAAGEALLRSNLSAYGNDPANWQLASGLSPQPVANLLCAFTAQPADATAAADGTAANAGASVAWTLFNAPEVTNFVSYRLTRSTKLTGETWVEIATVSTASHATTDTFTASDPDALDGQIYYYALDGIDAQGSSTRLGVTTTHNPWHTLALPLIQN